VDHQLIQEIKLRLKAPAVVIERIAEGRQVPKVFGKAALSELKLIQEMLEKAGEVKCK
jgi:hypothetical protein